jgi:hypothetical protein
MLRMDRRTLLQSLPALALTQTVALAGTRSPDAVYELRQYTVNPGKLDDLLARFRNHTIRIFDRHDMRSVAYWTAIDPAPDAPALIYILEHSSRETADRNWAAFRADPDWIKAKADSEANGPIVSKAQSTFMKLTDFSPLLAPPAS